MRCRSTQRTFDSIVVAVPLLLSSESQLQPLPAPSSLRSAPSDNTVWGAISLHSAEAPPEVAMYEQLKKGQRMRRGWSEMGNA